MFVIEAGLASKEPAVTVLITWSYYMALFTVMWAPQALFNMKGNVGGSITAIQMLWSYTARYFTLMVNFEADWYWTNPELIG